MDDLARNLRLVDVINASDAMNNARTLMEEHAEELLDEEQWEGIVRHVFPVLDAERARLDEEYQRLS